MINLKTKFISDTFVISFPKAGRTWLRVMFAKILLMANGDPKKLELLRYRHDGSNVQSYNESKEKWKDNKIILLVRDPRDIVVSFYFQITLRENNNYNQDISHFIRSVYGINNIIKFYNNWFENKHIPKEFMLVRYEDLKMKTMIELKRMCTFLDIIVEEEDLKTVIKYSSFENMKQMDIRKKGHPLSNKGALAVVSKNPEGLKVRKGKINGFKDYLNEVDIQYINEQLKLMHTFYNYNI